MGVALNSTPIGSLTARSLEERSQYASAVFRTPPHVQDLLFSMKTSSYLRGLVKSHRLPEEQAPHVAFAVLQICVGAKTFAQLPSLLSTELHVANDIAQRLATEIERDLFSPILLELNQFLAQKKSMGQHSSDQGLSNVVDLKHQNHTVTR